MFIRRTSISWYGDVANITFPGQINQIKFKNPFYPVPVYSSTLLYRFLFNVALHGRALLRASWEEEERREDANRRSARRHSGAECAQSGFVKRGETGAKEGGLATKILYQTERRQ